LKKRSRGVLFRSFYLFRSFKVVFG